MQKKPSQFYVQEMECFVFYKSLRDHRQVADHSISPPWCLTVRAIGHSFAPSTEVFVPKIAIDSRNMVCVRSTSLIVSGCTCGLYILCLCAPVGFIYCACVYLWALYTVPVCTCGLYILCLCAPVGFIYCACVYLWALYTVPVCIPVFTCLHVCLRIFDRCRRSVVVGCTYVCVIVCVLCEIRMLTTDVYYVCTYVHVGFLHVLLCSCVLLTMSLCTCVCTVKPR